MLFLFFFFFFFQAEDGIRDWSVTGVQTCALPIWDRISAEIVPKGVLVMGISGCGKSLSIKAVASCFELPLYRIDMIAIFSGRHGTPESEIGRASCRERV